MLSYNRKFGLGAALRQRSIWAGSARSANGLVTTQLNPYKPRGQTSPASLYLEAVTHNGSVYVGMVGWACYTSPDLVTFTQRTYSSSNFRGVAAAGTRLVALIYTSGPGLIVSSDNGASWGSYTTVMLPGTDSARLRVAGGVVFVFSTVFASATVYSVNSTGAVNTLTMPESRSWVAVGSTGTAWVLISSTGTAVYSTTTASWTVSTSYASEAAKLPAPPSQVYAVGSRLVAVAVTDTVLTTIYSDDDGATWHQGASYGVFLEGRPFSGLSPYSAVLDGHLYVSAGAGGKGLMLSTHNGISWRAHTDINADGTVPGLFKRPGGESILFNGSATAGPALETNTGAQELYYEL